MTVFQGPGRGRGWLTPPHHRPARPCHPALRPVCGPRREVVGTAQARGRSRLLSELSRILNVKSVSVLKRTGSPNAVSLARFIRVLDLREGFSRLQSAPSRAPAPCYLVGSHPGTRQTGSAGRRRPQRPVTPGASLSGPRKHGAQAQGGRRPEARAGPAPQSSDPGPGRRLRKQQGLGRASGDGRQHCALPAGTPAAPHQPSAAGLGRPMLRGCSARWLCPCPGDLGSGGQVVTARGGRRGAAGKQARRGGGKRAHRGSRGAVSPVTFFF